MFNQVHKRLLNQNAKFQVNLQLKHYLFMKLLKTKTPVLLAVINFQNYEGCSVRIDDTQWWDTRIQEWNDNPQPQKNYFLTPLDKTSQPYLYEYFSPPFSFWLQLAAGKFLLFFFTINHLNNFSFKWGSIIQFCIWIEWWRHFDLVDLTPPGGSNAARTGRKLHAQWLFEPSLISITSD